MGFLGPLISPEKSIFLFDPLIVLTILVATLGWKYFSPAIKSYVIAALLLVLAYICLYARYTVWSGNFAWADRYVSTAVELAAFISVPILLKYRAYLGRFVWTSGMVLVAVSLAVQVASLMFWLPLEIYQGDDFGHPQWVIWLRFKNIVAFAFGKNGRLGPEYRFHDLRPVGLSAHNDVEFSPICAAESRGCAEVACRWCVCHLVRGHRRFAVFSPQAGRIYHPYGRMPP